jgi:hypothetical protein
MAIAPPIQYAPGSDNPLPSSAVYDVNGVPVHVSVANPLPVAVTNGGTASSYVVQLLYQCINTFVDANGTVSFGDLLQNITAYDSSGILILDIWVDITAGFTLAANPVPTDVSPYTPSGGLTNAELRASPVPFTTTQLPATIGQKTSAQSTSVVMASDATTPLPTGAATSALQITGNASLATIATETTAIAGQLPASLGQKASAGSLSTVLASDATLPLPTGAATATNQTAGNAVLSAISGQLPPSLGLKAQSSSLSVVVANPTSGDIAITALYEVTTAFTGANLKDILQSITIYAPGAPPTLVSITWLNLTQGTTLSSAPSVANITPSNGGSSGGSGYVATTALYQANVTTGGATGLTQGNAVEQVTVWDPTTIPPTLISTSYNDLVNGRQNLTVTNINQLNVAGATTTLTFEYTAKATNALVGYNSGDAISQVQTINSLNGSTLVTVWNNITQGTALASTPALTDLTAYPAQLPPSLGPQTAANSLSVYVQNPSTGSTSVVNTYTVTTGWTDGTTAISIGDTLQQILIFNTTGTLTSTIWFDVNLAYTLQSPPPSYTLITQTSSSSATAINQTTQITAANLTNTNLSTISGQLPTSVGQKASAASLPVVVASDNTIATSSTQLPSALGAQLSTASLSVVLGTGALLPLPNGAATSSLQTTGNSSLANIDTSTASIATTATAISGQLPASLGPKSQANSLPVVVANPVSGDTATSALYQVATAFTGAAVNDILEAIFFYAPGAPSTLISTTWQNLTQGTVIAAPSNIAFVVPVTGGGGGGGGGSPAVTANYVAINTGTGYAAGDSIQSVSVLNSVTGAPTITVWNNLTQGAVITPAPTITDLSAQPFTTQLPPALGLQPATSSLSVVVANNATYTPSLTSTSTSGSTAAGVTTLSFANVGGAAVTVGGATLPAGGTMDYVAPVGGTIQSMTYNATGSTLLISTLAIYIAP